MGSKPVRHTGVAFDYVEAREKALDVLSKTRTVLDQTPVVSATSPFVSIPGRRTEVVLRPPLSPEAVASARSRLLQRFSKESRKLTDEEMRQLSKTERRRRRRLEREG